MWQDPMGAVIVWEGSRGNLRANHFLLARQHMERAVILNKGSEEEENS